MNLWHNPSRLTSACILFCIGLLVAGLWPFNFRVGNHAALISDGSEAFYLGQWKSSLIVRSFIQPSAGGKPYDEIGVGGVLAAGRKSAVTIVSRPFGTVIYINGQPTKNIPGVRLLKENETLNGHKVFFGNAPDLACPWTGSIRAFAIYGKALTSAEVMERRAFQANGQRPCGSRQDLAVACYHFDGLQHEFISDFSGSANDLWKPDYLVFEKRALGLPAGHSFSLSDLTLNLIGFMPLGFLLCLRLLSSNLLTLKNCLIYSVAAGFAVSLLIFLWHVV